MKNLLYLLMISFATMAIAQEELLPTINLNDMTQDQLTNTIPDFSKRMVREFFEYQPYISIQQFRREMSKYIDAEQIAFYEHYVFVPMNINESDAATIMQLSGLDEESAEALLAARPYETSEAFLAKLAELLLEFDLDLVASYLVSKG